MMTNTKGDMYEKVYHRVKSISRLRRYKYVDDEYEKKTREEIDLNRKKKKKATGTDRESKIKDIIT